MLGLKIQLQYHDEIGFSFPEKDTDKVKTILLQGIENANLELKLNVPLGISIDIGNNYGEAH